MRLGTLLAERLLYAPSVGYCMLLSLCLYTLSQHVCSALLWAHDRYEEMVKATDGVKNSEVKDGKKEKKNRSHAKKSGVKNEVKEGIDGGDVSPTLSNSSNGSNSGSGKSNGSGSGKEKEHEKEKEKEIEKEKEKEKENEKEKERSKKIEVALAAKIQSRVEWVASTSKCIYWIFIIAITVTYIRLTVSTVRVSAISVFIPYVLTMNYHSSVD